jgi:hypothetical protein
MLGAGSSGSFVVPFSSLSLGSQLFSERRDKSSGTLSFDISLQTLAHESASFEKESLAGGNFGGTLCGFEPAVLSILFFSLIAAPKMAVKVIACKK